MHLFLWKTEHLKYCICQILMFISIFFSFYTHVYKASIFLLIDLREIFLRFWVGGRKKN